jgi:formylmethanofuran dehydrogenase subunit D
MNSARYRARFIVWGTTAWVLVLLLFPSVVLPVSIVFAVFATWAFTVRPERTDSSGLPDMREVPDEDR